MPYLTAHLLDRFNERLVNWLLKNRQPTSERKAIVDYLADLGSAVHPSIDQLAPFEPIQGSHGLWEAASPWPEATGENGRWYAERRPPAGAPQGLPAVILLHGWLADRIQLSVYRWWARQLAKHGIDVWLPRLPFHLERAGPGEVSGQRCLSADLGASLDSVRQAVVETRALAAWLRRRGASRVGLWGMSFGGWVGALVATLDEDLAAAALWAPVAAPREVLWEGGLVRRLRRAVLHGGSSDGDFAGPAVDAMTPELLEPRLPREKILLLGAIHDQVVFPPSLARMSRRWNVPVRWVPHGHISLMVSRRSVQATSTFFREALAGRPTPQNGGTTL